MIGQTISHYRILRQLGGGGMGIVYEAEDLRLGRRVALKFLPERLCSDASALERFQREARATSVLNHPNICTIYDIEEYEGRPFIVMELLQGESLKERLAPHHDDNGNYGGPLPIDELLDIAVQVTDGLDAAHSQGVIHRDIKPANIFITKRGQAKILDFGLAKLAPTSPLVRNAIAPVEQPHRRAPAGAQRIDPKLLRAEQAAVAQDDASSLTALGSIPGTVAYMSPEQVRGEELDTRSDLFSFGVVLYEIATGEKPFTGASPVLTLAAVLDDKPVSPVSRNPELPPHFEAIVGKALEKDRERRYQTAAAFRADLMRLKRESEPELSGVDAITARPRGVFRRVSLKYRYVQLALAAFVLTVAFVFGLWWFKQQRAATSVGRNSVAVLPLQNMGGDSSNEFLRVALADEITTILTYTPGLEVRPVGTAMKYATNSPPDPQAAGRDLKVADVITGHYIREGNNLIVTLEAVEVKRNRILWQGTLTVPANDLIAMQKQLAAQVRQGLLPVLGAGTTAIETATRPKNPEAYDLFLRSVAVPHDATPNREAIQMLERSVGMDPSYAPAWDALGLRYYYDAQYSGGGSAMFDRASAAYERALSLDPNFVQAAAHLARNRVERGDLVSAYQQAQALVRRRPDNAQAHFTLSYVLRYAGLLEDSQRECDVAVGLDPGNYVLRSCSIPFFEAGKWQRALDYLALDSGSEWTNNFMPMVLLREGDLDQARRAARRLKDDQTWFGPILQTCLGEPGAAADMDKLDAIVRADAPALLAQRDPEFRYLNGSILVFCGEREVGVRVLRSAIDQNYCATEALDKDPLLARLREYPEFAALRSASQDCQKRFLTGRGQHVQ